MGTSAIDSVDSLTSKGSYMGPNDSTLLVAQSQLSICVMPAGIDVVLVCQRERMSTSGSNHNNPPA